MKIFVVVFFFFSFDVKTKIYPFILLFASKIHTERISNKRKREIEDEIYAIQTATNYNSHPHNFP